MLGNSEIPDSFRNFRNNQPLKKLVRTTIKRSYTQDEEREVDFYLKLENDILSLKVVSGDKEILKERVTIMNCNGGLVKYQRGLEVIKSEIYNFNKIKCFFERGAFYEIKDISYVNMME